MKMELLWRNYFRVEVLKCSGYACSGGVIVARQDVEGGDGCVEGVYSVEIPHKHTKWSP